MAINYKQINDLDFFKFSRDDLECRFVPLFPIYRNNNWEMYINTENGFLPLNIVDRADGFYISKEAVVKTDLRLNFFNFMLKKNNFKENLKLLSHIYDDVYNLVASVEKINFFASLHNMEENFKLCKYASIELESIFQNSRAVFDNLQKVQDNLLKNIVSINSDDYFSEKKVQFGINKEKRKLTIDEYIKKYKIPELLAKFYVDFQDFFFFILNNRNDIFHSKKTFKLFLGEEGFSISLKEYELENLYFWNNDNTLRNNLGSIKSLLAYIILNTINALEEYSKTIELIIKLPDSVIPEYEIFIRSEFNNTIFDLDTYKISNAWNNKKNG
ncbi:hypothetical protein ACN5O4_03940 [Aliarcobacter butzleri]|uniref:hypothetical protein n=1 Tax=Aliarcobacter butzleri TaxID=28197 RepID=UPI003AF62C11